jgi:Ni/Co efflux regulator RcnB
MHFLPGLVPMRRRRSSRLMLATLAVSMLAASLAAPADAQRRSRYPNELRGSQASVQKMWDFAQTHGLTFYQTPKDVEKAIADGRLVALTGDSTYEVTRAVRYAYATPEARQFVLAFAPQYLAACGTPLTVTSAARPTNRQPRNSNPFSVHPTGIAVDLRRPPAGRCQTWLRQALAELELQGYVEATEERRPVHIHVAVLTEPGKDVALPPLVAGTLARSSPRPQQSNGVIAARPTPLSAVGVSNPAAGNGAGASDAIRAATYRVREGDTLWDVARRSGVSVRALARANHRSERAVLRAGTTLRLPERPDL